MKRIPPNPAQKCLSCSFRGSVASDATAKGGFKTGPAWTRRNLRRARDLEALDAAWRHSEPPETAGRTGHRLLSRIDRIPHQSCSKVGSRELRQHRSVRVGEIVTTRATYDARNASLEATPARAAVMPGGIRPPRLGAPLADARRRK